MIPFMMIVSDLLIDYCIFFFKKRSNYFICYYDKHRKLGKDVKAIVYRNVAHGFIQFVQPIKECELSITDAINLMNQLIQDSNLI